MSGSFIRLVAGGFGAAARPATGALDDVLRLGDDAARLSDDAFGVGDDALRLGDDAFRLTDDGARLTDDAGWLTDDAARLTDDVARGADDVPIQDNLIPSSYARESVDDAVLAYGDDVGLRVRPQWHDPKVVDELDQAIWLDDIRLAPEGIVRYRNVGAPGVLDDPARFTNNHDLADLSTYTRLRDVLQPGRHVDDMSGGWSSADDAFSGGYGSGYGSISSTAGYADDSTNASMAYLAWGDDLM